MNLLDIILIAVGLAMDCFAVSIACGIIMKKLPLWPSLRIALMFGFFQGLMPLIGWLVGSTFQHLIENFDHWVAFGILILLGIRMIYEQYHSHPDQKKLDPYKWKVVILLAVATSIDALAVGLSFAFLNIDLWLSIGLIFLASLLFSALGLVLGSRYCCKFRIPAELIGGLVLIAIGIKILLEHLCS
jgi:manganese efflux pump family protein